MRVDVEQNGRSVRGGSVSRIRNGSGWKFDATNRTLLDDWSDGGMIRFDDGDWNGQTAASLLLGCDRSGEEDVFLSAVDLIQLLQKRRHADAFDRTRAHDFGRPRRVRFLFFVDLERFQNVHRTPVVLVEHAIRSEDSHVAELSSRLDASRQANDRHRKEQPQRNLVVGTPVSFFRRHDKIIYK